MGPPVGGPMGTAWPTSLTVAQSGGSIPVPTSCQPSTRWVRVMSVHRRSADASKSSPSARGLKYPGLTTYGAVLAQFPPTSTRPDPATHVPGGFTSLAGAAAVPTATVSVSRIATPSRLPSLVSSGALKRRPANTNARAASRSASAALLASVILLSAHRQASRPSAVRR